MKRFSRMGRGLAGLLCIALVASTAMAEDTPAKKRSDRSQASRIDSKARGAHYRASKLMGKNLQNEAGESVGEVNDIVLDANTGKVRYLAVTYGGFLGLGNKMFAVPYEAITCRPDSDDRDETVLILDVTQKQLEGAVGFDEDNWPNFADKKFTSELDKRYGVDRPKLLDRIRDRDVDVRVGPDGVDVNIDSKPDNE